MSTSSTPNKRTILYAIYHIGKEIADESYDDISCGDLWDNCQIMHILGIIFVGLGQPGKRLSDLFGAFDVNIDPTDSSNYVLKQAAPTNTGANAWGHRNNPLPFTSFPSGTNWANYNISARVLCQNEKDTVMLCGRVVKLLYVNMQCS